ncbi:MAG: thioredoxin domain-containing protein [Planctomycetota bacterium]|jgi:uncharacterized protein YyaL (SSP411 family)
MHEYVWLLALCLLVSVAWSADITHLPTLEQRRRLPGDGGTDFNRLIHASSPYLLQHATNPVDWYEWGDEAFARAAAEGKPVFLSIGYSTCHWCHVMAAESFADPAIAAVINEHFIAVKLDREERPDVDAIYMAYVQATTGRGGWPMSVFLTPDRRPFFAGTYFPPRHFSALLTQLAQGWRERRDEVDRIAAQAVARLQAEASQDRGGSLDQDPPLASAQGLLATRFDIEHGGFGDAPKFPQPGQLTFLLERAALYGDEEAQRLVVATLDAMAAGGIHDQLGGGFHRYSVDRYWHVPHFEKMLYDQGLLLACYVDAYRLTGAERHAVVARAIADYLLRDLRDEAGGFHAAEDADSRVSHDSDDHHEGAFYTWTATQLAAALDSADAALAAAVYDVREQGNVRPESDPLQELVARNVLVRTTHQADQSQVAAISAALRQAREQRPRPHRDDKILCAWNGLAIAGLARAGAVFGDDTYLDAALGAAAFIRAHLDVDGELYRSWRQGQRGSTLAMAADYAALIHGLLELYRASGDRAHLYWAGDLQQRMDALFYDETNGGWFDSRADSTDLLVRTKEIYDGAEPAPSSLAVANCFQLAALLGDDQLAARGTQALAACAGDLQRQPLVAMRMLAAWQAMAAPTVVIVGADEPAAALAAAANRVLVPGLTILRLRAGDDALIGNRPWLSAMAAAANGASGATAYVCHDGACQRPTADVAELTAQLRAGRR